MVKTLKENGKGMLFVNTVSFLYSELFKFIDSLKKLAKAAKRIIKI